MELYLIFWLIAVMTRCDVCLSTLKLTSTSPTRDISFAPFPQSDHSGFFRTTWTSSAWWTTRRGDMMTTLVTVALTMHLVDLDGDAGACVINATVKKKAARFVAGARRPWPRKIAKLVTPIVVPKPAGRSMQDKRPAGARRDEQSAPATAWAPHRYRVGARGKTATISEEVLRR